MTTSQVSISDTIDSAQSIAIPQSELGLSDKLLLQSRELLAGLRPLLSLDSDRFAASVKMCEPHLCFLLQQFLESKPDNVAAVFAAVELEHELRHFSSKRQEVQGIQKLLELHCHQLRGVDLAHIRLARAEWETVPVRIFSALTKLLEVLEAGADFLKQHAAVPSAARDACRDFVRCFDAAFRSGPHLEAIEPMLEIIAKAVQDYFNCDGRTTGCEAGLRALSKLSNAIEMYAQQKFRWTVQAERFAFCPEMKNIETAPIHLERRRLYSLAWEVRRAAAEISWL